MHLICPPKFWECGRSKQGALWGMGKWRIGQRPSNLVRNLPLATLHPTLMLHFSWFAYAAVMRIYKHYFFNLKDPSTGRFKNQFSFFAESTPCFPLDMPPFFLRHRQLLWNAAIVISSSNNQRLRSAGDDDRRSKRFCSSAVLCVSFTWQMVKTRVISLRAIESPNTSDQITFFAFPSFLVKSKRMLATYMRNNSLGPVVRRLISA